MSRSIRVEAEARDEIIAAARHYEKRERGRGDLLSDAVFNRMERLTGFPKAGSPVRGVNGGLLARQVRLQRYPYVIVYVALDDAIRVVAIAHEKQMPPLLAVTPRPVGRPRHSTKGLEPSGVLTRSETGGAARPSVSGTTDNRQLDAPSAPLRHLRQVL